MSRTIGTHNLHDYAGVPTFFADAIGFCEAIPANIIARKRARNAKAGARLRGYTIRTCTHQKDLVAAFKRWHWKVTATRYVPVHGGVAKVTPHRGVFVVETRRRVGKLRRAKGRREVFLWEHRINAAFPPYVRGEDAFRADMWGKHASTTEELAEQYLDDGWTVYAAGDVNTPKGVDGYPFLPFEVGHGFDRIASSARLRAPEYLSRMGSDHPRLRATMDD